MYGSSLFADLVDVTFDITRRFYEMLEAAPDFEPLHEPECNILCFRYVPELAREMSAEALAISAGALAPHRGRRPLLYHEHPLEREHGSRVTLMNPFTDDNHLEALLERLRFHGGALLRDRVW